MNKLKAIVTILKHPRLYAKYAERIIAVQKSMSATTNSVLTPQLLGWHHYTIVGGEKPKLYIDGTQSNADISIEMWLSRPGFEFFPPVGNPIKDER